MRKPGPPHIRSLHCRDEGSRPPVYRTADDRGECLFPRLKALVGINNDTHVVSGTSKCDSKCLNETLCLQSSLGGLIVSDLIKCLKISFEFLKIKYFIE